MGDAKVKLVFLDACRDNPFAARSAALPPGGAAFVSGCALPVRTRESSYIPP
jgi:uncharacterized caspase-like protein